MLLIDPKDIVFEDTTDVVNYVTKGFTPIRKDFDRVIKGIRFPASQDDMLDMAEDEVVIPDSIFIDITNEEFANILEQIYENNCRKRNIMIGIGITIGAVLIAGKISSEIKKKKAQKEFDAEFRKFIDDHSSSDAM